ncbi:TonB-dependent receptor [uncultured Sphingomonas sp.]|uniref:TonB-dependent receptor n=1 Tax=uncultured Sphingomonas sp. TaxID=158754 RepID=UPI0035C9E6AE
MTWITGQIIGEECMRAALMIGVAWGAIALVSSPSYGQQTTSPDPSTTSPSTEPKVDSAAADTAQEVPASGLGDIIVTAQRREENLQRAAVPVDVISPSALLRSGISNPTALGSLVPSLSVTPAGGGRPNIFLRGVGNFTANPLFDSSIAFNYDNVYLGRPGSTSGFFYDLERIEVLKGPQGTLYGRNATGGAINVIPVRPKAGKLSGYLTASYGNYDSVTAEGAINLPLGPNGALRVSGSVIDHDGYLSDGTSDEKTRAFRVQLLGELTPDLTVRVSGDYESLGGRGVGAYYVSAYRFNPAAGQYVVTPSGLGPNVGLFDPKAQAFRRTLFGGPAGRTLTDLQDLSYVDNEYFGVNAEIAYQTRFGTLTVIPALRSDTQDNTNNTQGFLANVFQKDEQFSTEARFAGDRVGPIDYTLGALYFWERNKARFAVGQQALANFQDNLQKTESKAVFARLTAHLTDAFRLVGGVRYTHDSKDFSGTADGFTVVCAAPACPTAPLLPQVSFPSQFGLPLPAFGAVVPLIGTGAILARGPLIAVNNTQTMDRITYRGAIEVDVALQSLLYASVETGFRSGGQQPVRGFEQYQPEYITAWTAGSKNRFFDNRLQLNVEAFLWKYRNQQLASIGVDSTGRQNFFVRNIGRSTNYGAEAEARLLATPTTILNAQVQYLHTNYDRFTYVVPTGNAPPFTGCAAAISPTAPTTRIVDCSGRPAFNSPKWTVNLGVDQTFEIGDYKLVATANTQYRSSRYVGFDFVADQLVGSTWQSDAQLTFAPADDRWSVAGFVRNIENDRFLLNANTLAVGSAVVALPNVPRTYGVRGSVKF